MKSKMIPINQGMVIRRLEFEIMDALAVEDWINCAHRLTIKLIKNALAIAKIAAFLCTFLPKTKGIHIFRLKNNSNE